MPPSSIPAATALAATLALSAGASSARAQAPDPFAPQRRWTAAPAAAEPWLPRSLAFAVGGELVWAAGSVGAPRAMLLSASELPAGGVTAPLSEHPLAGALGTVHAVAGPGPDALYTASQTPAPTSSKRLTRVTRLRAPGGVLEPIWSRDHPLVGNGPVEIAADRAGARVAVAVHDAAIGLLLVEWLDAQTGGVLAGHALSAGTLRELALSADGSRTAVVAGAELWVFDPTGAVLHHQALGLVTSALALSGDGTRLAVGDGDRVRMLEDQGGWTERGTVPGAPGEVAVRVALSDDGSVLAAGWWNQVNGVDVRFQVWDGDAGALLFELLQRGVPGGLQGFPEVVAVTPDGRRAAFGTWGVGDPQAEVILVEVGSGSVVLQEDLPGSVRALALDPTGTRVAVGMKHAHANQFAATGEIRLYDTGERELQVIGQPYAAGALHLAARRPGASRTLFVLGTPLGTPVPFRGGGLWIDRGLPSLVRNRPADASGRSDAVLSLPGVSAALGLDFAVQVVWRVAGGLEFGHGVLVPAVF